MVALSGGYRTRRPRLLQRPCEEVLPQGDRASLARGAEIGRGYWLFIGMLAPGTSSFESPRVVWY